MLVASDMSAPSQSGRKKANRLGARSMQRACPQVPLAAGVRTCLNRRATFEKFFHA
jgi:hypothetical protein